MKMGSVVQGRQRPSACHGAKMQWCAACLVPADRNGAPLAGQQPGGSNQAPSPHRGRRRAWAWESRGQGRGEADDALHRGQRELRAHRCPCTRQCSARRRSGAAS